ncbi:aminotransferase class I/II-fold pyridoxal phosphate-dependent enzyme [Aquimarina sp. RZ0]|uniref:aminotransferase class I/II-fold pyridoxal phosphate-dependent enzyme n=1 Tax=Aquimarina sp. RZ0 TaxID=2607730 RepID=UPI0011F3800E|nr:aminotransferase class I/II-fold pyridoxal phosphate-dependent enzyme [Aquimarina sp. RZ0]KAA1244681.1 aminotransferase class I/II-fold pyridoxal phosphate-dependent enzyme [Aquimarina sp. RZ0]
MKTKTKIKTLADYVDFPELDIMGRAVKFKEWTNNLDYNKHYNYKRVAMNASSPIRLVKDRYTGETREMIYFASNDYLNLANHPEVIEAGVRATRKYGAGAGSVPLLGGTTELHRELENKIAKFKGCEKSIIYSSGYGSNSSSLLSLLGEKDIAIVDMLAHASLIDGCKNTNVKYFKHNDMSSLEFVLSKVKNNFRTKLIVVDGVYSMDGDIAPLDKIKELAEQYGAYVMVDEAHATGVIGENGHGTPEHFNLSGKVDIVSGTFSKALGGVGGFVAASEELIDLLHFYSRGYIFSTALTPQVAGSMICSLNVIENDKKRREKLWSNIRYFKKNLIDLGLNIGNSETAIFPIIIGDDLITKEIARELHEMNIYVNPVLYPAVSKRLSRIRMSLMSEHTIEHIDKVLEALKYLVKKYNLT